MAFELGVEDEPEFEDVFRVEFEDRWGSPVNEALAQAYAVLFIPRRGGHPCVELIRGSTLEEALLGYFVSDNAGLSVEPDGKLVERYSTGDDGRLTQLRYDHVAAYVEANYLTEGDWQIRRIREPDLQADHSELAVGLNPFEMKDIHQRALAIVRDRRGLRRPRHFFWLLRDGPLISFYRKRGPFQIEIHTRLLAPGWDPERLTPWHGSYSDILDQLYLHWSDSP